MRGRIYYSESWDEVNYIAESFGMPIGETHAELGSVRKGSEMLIGCTDHLGTPSAGNIAEIADVVICVGTRLNNFLLGSYSGF